MMEGTHASSVEDRSLTAWQPVLLPESTLATGDGFLAIFTAAADCEAVIPLTGRRPVTQGERLGLGAWTAN